MPARRKYTPVQISIRKSVIAELALTGSPSMTQVSKEIGLSRRTLQRRLSEQNLTFRIVLSQVRLELAQGLLRQTDLPVQDVATLLGYKKPGAFARAFKQWTDQSPRTYRNSGGS